MVRPIRIEYPGACYHVTARGNERKEIFRADSDHELFLATIQSTLQQFGVVLHGYCLMPNHYHLLLQTPSANLSRALGWLQTTYTIRYNRKHQRAGHLFQGRYKAHLIEADEYARHLITYIHLNPVRPKDKTALIPPERLKTLQTYAWSSHSEYAGKRQTEWVNTDWLSYWATRKKHAQRLYCAEIQQWFGKTMPTPWAQLQDGLVLGGEQLLEKAQTILAKKQGAEEMRWKDHRSTQEILKLMQQKQPDQIDERIAMWLRVQFAGQSRIEIAREFGYRDGSAVTHVVNRLEQHARKDKKLQCELNRWRNELSCFKS